MPNWRRLERKLRRGVDLVRADSARAIGVWGGERATPLLLDAVKDVDACVRVAALEALARLGADCAHDAFLHALNSVNVDEQRAGLKGLGAIRAPGVETVVAGLLDSRDDDVVAAAIRTLGRVSEVRLPLTVVQFAEDGRDEVRAAVQFALFEKPDREAIPVVRAGLRDASEAVRAEAVWAALAVARREPTLLVGSLLDPSPHVASQALDALAALCGHLPLEGFGAIARPWIAARDREALAARVLDLLVEVEERFEGAWFDVVRFRAAENDRAVIEDLKWAVVNEKECRAMAIEELAKLDYDAAAPYFRRLAGALFERAPVRIAANAALTRFGDRAAESAFLKALRSRRDEIRGMACESAPWTASEAAVTLLRTQVPSGDAIVALGRLRDAQSASAFQECAMNAHLERDVRTDAVWALAAVTERAAATPLEHLALADGDSVVREAAARALWLMGVEIVSQPAADAPRLSP